MIDPVSWALGQLTGYLVGSTQNQEKREPRRPRVIRSHIEEIKLNEFGMGYSKNGITGVSVPDMAGQTVWVNVPDEYEDLSLRGRLKTWWKKRR